MTPTWAVILVGLAGGAVGSLLTAFVTISHERASEFRSHLLNAAYEFSTGAIAALQQARLAAGEILKQDLTTPLSDRGRFRPEIQANLDKANGAVDEVF